MKSRMPNNQLYGDWALEASMYKHDSQNKTTVDRACTLVTIGVWQK